MNALRRDVDQLWAEAANLEAQGVSIRLDEGLWAEAAKVQQARQVENPYFDVLEDIFDTREGKVPGMDVYRLLSIPPERQHQGVQEQVSDAMKKLGWEKKKIKVDGKSLGGYTRGTSSALIRAAEDGNTKRWKVLPEDPFDRLTNDQDSD